MSRPPRVLAVSPPRVGPWVRELDLLARAGVDALILRLVDQPEALAAVLGGPLPPGLQILVRPVAAGDPQRAREHGRGLHLPDRPPAPGEEDLVVSAAAHGPEGLARAAALGCAWALLSPVFAPGSKPGDARPPLGLAGLAAACAGAPLPVLALGGISPENAAACRRAGAWGVAALGACFRDGHVDAARAAALVTALAA
ncbi:thiamine phosphate synthase [Myxococcota bacterium]|nr:thiamine phosphate synthase [Myxococcota bacterium]